MKKRTTKLIFNRLGIKVVIWKKENRPTYRHRVTDEQIVRAREMMIEMREE